MKKQFVQTKNEAGFYLPLVLVVTTLVLSFITTIVILYQNDVRMTKTIVNQIEMDTLIQMSKEEFTRDIVHLSDSNEKLVYHYPNGDVEIQYEREANETWLVNCTIFLENEKQPMTASYLVTLNHS